MSKTVLICDNCSFIRERLKEILLKDGYQTIWEAKDGDEAIKKYKELSPDIVVLDLVLPKVDGLMVLQQIKNNNPSASVIICSSFSQKSVILGAIKLGATDFIAKPGIEMISLALQSLFYRKMAHS